MITLPEGFFLYRENFMFGTCYGYQNKAGEYLFKFPDEILALLKV